MNSQLFGLVLARSVNRSDVPSLMAELREGGLTGTESARFCRLWNSLLPTLARICSRAVPASSSSELMDQSAPRDNSSRTTAKLDGSLAIVRCRAVYK